MATEVPSMNVTRRYVLGELLGQGGMGAVYRALDRLTGRAVALKRLLTDSAHLHLHDSQEMRDFRFNLAREFKLAVSLRHPNIVQMLDYGFDETQHPFFTMELLDAPKTLFDASLYQSLDTKIELIIQVLTALSYLHRRGIVHRDLKPANILTIKGQVKVLDFGLSTMHERNNPQENETGTTAGTLAYMSPEVLLGETGGVASDLYAVGMMAYEVIAGYHPFNLEQPAHLIQQIVTETPDINVLDIPLSLSHVIQRLLDKDPFLRYQDANVVIESIHQAMSKQYATNLEATRESFLQAARLIGRDAELEQLQGAVNSVLMGHGSAYLLAGESGVGKTRLVDELRTMAMVNGVVVMRGQASNFGNRPFEVWLPIMRWLCLLSDELDDADVAFLKNFVTDIEVLFPKRNLDGIEAEQLHPDILREYFVRLLERIITHQKKPVVILLEDLHWAGSESINALASFSEIVKNLPVLVLGTYRDDEVPSLSKELSKMEIIKLKRLDEKNISDLSAAMLGATGRNPQVVDLLKRESEGNVFFIIEVIRALSEQVGNLENIGLTTLPSQVFAGGIKTVVQRRLNQLDEPSRFLISVAALMGSKLDLRVLRRVSPDISQQDWLAKCANAAVLAVEDDVWTFAHDKLRQALVENLLDVERKIMHGRAAVAMEYYYSEIPTYGNVLAYHFGQAGDITKEEQYITVAGEQSVKMGGYHEALKAFRRAESLVVQLNLSQDRALQRLVKIRQLIGEAYLGIGEYEIGQNFFMDALELTQQLKDKPGIANAHTKLGEVSLALEKFQDAETHFSKALEIFQELQDTRRIAATFNRLGDVMYEKGDSDSAKRYFQQSLDLTRQSGHDWNMAGATRQQATQEIQISLTDSQHKQTRLMLMGLLETYRQRNDANGMGETLMRLGANSFDYRDYDDAFDCYNQALVIYQTLNDDISIIHAYDRLASVSVRKTDLKTAWHFYQQALITSQKTALHNLTLQMLAGTGRLLYQQGHKEKALLVLGFVLNHPQTPEELQDEIEGLVFDLQDGLDPKRAEQIWEEGKSYDLKRLVNNLL
jgi:predicted ATPase